MTREGKAGLITAILGSAAVLAFIVYAQSNGGHHVAPPAHPTPFQACSSAMPDATDSMVYSCSKAVERKEQAQELQRGIDGYNAAVERAARSRR